MTDDQADRIADLAARRYSGAAAEAVAAPRRPAVIQRGKAHAALKSRYLAFGLSVAAVSGLSSGMWTQAAMAANSAAPETPRPSVASAPAAKPAKEQIVYLVIPRRAPQPAGGTLRNTAIPQSPTVAAPAPPTKPAQRSVAPVPIARSHGSR